MEMLASFTKAIRACKAGKAMAFHFLSPITVAFFSILVFDMRNTLRSRMRIATHEALQLEINTYSGCCHRFVSPPLLRSEKNHTSYCPLDFQNENLMNAILAFCFTCVNAYKDNSMQLTVLNIHISQPGFLTGKILLQDCLLMKLEYAIKQLS